MILNLGCGSNKVEGAVNIDLEKSCKPDLILDFRTSIPFPADFADKIYLFHTIEHIEEKFHETILKECHRILKPSGSILISYPEFTTCAQNYIRNFKGQRDFWKATIFGRQLYPSDYHVSLMDSSFFSSVLYKCGFGSILCSPESEEEKFNTLVSAVKSETRLTYEDTINKFIFGIETHGA